VNFRGVEICCPRCHGDLAWKTVDHQHLDCAACDCSYPVIEEIPDLRIFDDPYISAEQDVEKGRGIAAQLPDRTFEELIDFYYANTSVVPPEHARQYKAGLLGAEARARASLESWGAEKGESLLEIGCGTGPLLVAAQDRYKLVVGVDIAFRWLQVARKRLNEAKVDAPLICACAEALPFKRDVFGTVAADSTIELLHDQNAAVKELARTVTPGGNLLLATPNRFSLGPDPHTGLLAGSALPDAITAWYMRRKNAIPPVRKLLSARSVSRLVQEHGFRDIEVSLPDFPEDQLVHLSGLIRSAVKMYHVAKSAPAGGTLLKMIGPRLLLTARGS
jgi:ubiquinone/menaquinone biosynthesis C-methylase UbiE/uncharacterized protein YbaR (Trm112 family)